MPEGEVFVERRRYKRIDKSLTVKYKVVSLPAEITEIKKAAAKSTTETINISLGGIQLIDDEELVPEQILRIEMTPEGRSEPVITFAEVRWCAKDNRAGKYRCGIEFLVLKDEDKNLIEEIIEGQ